MVSDGRRRLISNTGALFVLQIASYILPFLIIPYLTRILGVSLYGVVALGLAMVQIACIVTDFGFNLSATRKIADHQSDTFLVKKIVGAVHVCKFFLIFPVFIFFFLFLSFQSEEYGKYSDFFWLLLISVVGQTFQPIWFFQGIERMGFITLFVVLARSSFVVFTILWVSSPGDYFWVAIANGAAQIAAAVFAIGCMVYLGYSPVWPGWSFIKAVFLESADFFWSRAAVATYTAGGAFYLGLVSNPTTVAYYSAAEQLYKGAQSIFQPVSQALYPYMTRTKDLHTFFKILKISIILSVLGLVVGSIIGKWALVILFGESFSESYSVLVIFMVTFCLTTPSILLGYPFLGALGDSRSANHSVITGGILQVLILVAIYFLGFREGVSVAFSVMLVEAFVLAYRTLRAKSILSFV